MRLLAAVLALAVVLSGCSGGASDDAAAPATATGSPGGGAAVAPNATAPVIAPAWAAGQSWSWTLVSGALQDGTADIKTIVLAPGEVGIEDAAQATVVYPFHLVPLGPVDTACLCWTAHGLPVHLLRFPLKAGDSFTADFWSAPGAQVTIAAANVTTPSGLESGYQSTVTDSAGGTFLQADYSPKLGQFVRVASYFGASEPFAEATLKAAGTAAGGVAYRATELARYTASTADPASLAPKALAVPADADLLLLACFLPATAQGFYSVELAAPGPSGTPVACGGASADQTRLAAVATATQAGPGSVTAQPGGSGAITVEVFAVDTTVA